MLVKAPGPGPTVILEQLVSVRKARVPMILRKGAVVLEASRAQIAG